MRRVIIFILFFLGALFLSAQNSFAQSCGSSNNFSCPSGTTCSCPEWTYDWQNGTDRGDCSCVREVSGQQSCYHTICPVGYRCVGTGGSSYCTKDSTTTTSTCPVECRATACGTGYENASGCGPITSTTPNFGCRSNQACCRPKTCGGGGGPTCPVPESCPPGTIRSNNIKSTQCLPSSCPLGTAQARGECCSEKKTQPQICGDWYKCPTPNNPDKLCRDCTDEVWECDGWTLTTYACIPLTTPTKIPTPTNSPTPTPTPTKTPTPTPTTTTPALTCKSLRARLGGVDITSNISKRLKKGDTAVFVGTINFYGKYMKSMTFQMSKSDGTVLETKTVTAAGTNSKSAAYSFTIPDYGGYSVKVVDITPQ